MALRFQFYFKANEKKEMLKFLLNTVLRNNLLIFYKTESTVDFEKMQKAFDNIENKISHVISKYGQEIEKKNKEFVFDYITIVYKLNKNLIDKISNFFIFDKDYLFEEYLETEIRYRKYSNTTKDANVFVENMKILQDAFKIKKLKIEPAISNSPVGISKYFFRSGNHFTNQTEQEKIIIKAIRDILDFSQIIDIIVNSETQDKKYKEVNFDFVFDLNDEEILREVFKNKNIYKDEKYVFILFYRGVSHHANVFNNISNVGLSKKSFIDANQKLFKNIRLIFKNDYDFAMQLSLKDIEKFDREFFYRAIVLLSAAFDIDEEKFYASDYFKKIILKNGLNISMFDRKNFKKEWMILKRYVLSIPELDYRKKTKMEMDFLNDAIAYDYKNENMQLILKEAEQQFLDIDYDSINRPDTDELINIRLNMVISHYDLEGIKNLDKVIEKAIELLDKIKPDKLVNNYETFFALFKRFSEILNRLERSLGNKVKEHVKRMYPIYLNYVNAVILKYVKNYLRKYNVKDVKQEKTDKPDDISILLIFDEKNKSELELTQQHLKGNLIHNTYKINIEVKAVVEK